MTTELCDIMRKHGSDKCLDGRQGKKCHDYTLFYHEIFRKFRHGKLSLLEVGILNGASLRGWREYFTIAEIYGLDVRAERLINEERITSSQCDQTNTWSIRKALGQTMRFSIVIDDGLHTPEANVTFFREVWPQTDWFYIVEDLKPKYLDETLVGMKAAHPDAKLEVIDRTYPGSKKDNRLILARR